MGVGYDGPQGDKGKKGDRGLPGPASGQQPSGSGSTEIKIKGEPGPKGDIVSTT